MFISIKVIIYSKNVTSADCPKKGYFHCNNGFCLPEVMTCNGLDECGDGSDEVEPCGK